MSGRLDLRRGVVVGAEPLEVEIAGERRPAWADTILLGEMREGDEVVVNVAAVELGLGSGGFDVVHVNLTRGLDGAAAGGAHVIKLNSKFARAYNNRGLCRTAEHHYQDAFQDFDKAPQPRPGVESQGRPQPRLSRPRQVRPSLISASLPPWSAETETSS